MRKFNIRFEVTIKEQAIPRKEIRTEIIIAENLKEAKRQAEKIAIEHSTFVYAWFVKSVKESC